MRPTSRLRRFGALVVVALLVGACSGGDDGEGTDTTDPSTSGVDVHEGSSTTATTAPIDSDDPDDPGFFIAREPGPDEDCPATD